MDRKLPFVGRIFWKVLIVVAVLAVIAWAVAIKVFEYEMQSQDYGGSVITWIIFSYLVHLWLLPEDEPYESTDQHRRPSDPDDDQS